MGRSHRSSTCYPASSIWFLILVYKYTTINEDVKRQRCCARLERHSACGKWRLGVCSLDERRRTSHPRSVSGLATCYGRRQSVETPDLHVERCRLSHRRPTAHVQRRLRSSLPGNAYARAHRI